MGGRNSLRHTIVPATTPATTSGCPPLGLPLLFGPDFGEMFRNQVRNLEEHRISILKAVFERPWLPSYRESFPTKPYSGVWHCYKLSPEG